jgi:hypothetical protein
MPSLFARLLRGDCTKALRERRRTRLEVESLEDRLVPTIVFNPAFGGETIKPGSTNVGLQNPSVDLLFSGPFWNTGSGKLAETSLLNGAKAILNSPYLSGLTQYGSSGTAHFAASWTDTNSISVDPHSGASVGDVWSFLQNSVSSRNAGVATIFVVVSDPNSSQSYDGGWNIPTDLMVRTPAPFYEPTHMIWIGTTSVFPSTDVFTSDLSHELAETMSDPNPGNGGTEVNPPSGLPASLANPGGNQIGDYEPAAAYQVHYAYRLNGPGGVLVQPYWSAKDNAFIVPDGQTDNFYLNPIWTSSNTFTGTYSLSVQGDQLGNHYYAPISDNIVIDHAFGAQGEDVKATLNGQSATFDAGTIKTVSVNPGGGFNTVRIAAVPSNVAVNVNGGRQSSDTVIVGNTGHSLVNILGAVSVTNATGQTDLQIDDAQGGKENIDFLSNAVNINGALITFGGASRSPNGSLTGVTRLEVIDGFAANKITVSSLPPLTAVTLYADFLDQIFDPTNLLHVKYTHGFATAPGNL